MNEKQTSDMYLAATLVSYGAEIDSVDKSDPKRQMFCFQDSASCGVGNRH